MRQRIFIPMFGHQMVDVIMRNGWQVCIRMIWAKEWAFVHVSRETWKKWRA